MKSKIIDHFSNSYVLFYGQYLSKIQNINDNEYKAICPFHDDNDPSLSFNSDTGQYYCHGCGEKGDIFHFYGKLNNLNTKQNFNKIIKGICSDFNISSYPTKSKIIKTYDYQNVNGELLYQVCRMEPKDFRQRQPNGNGGWIWNLKNVERVLYNLTSIINSQEVVIVEGEKDVDNLSKLGIIATTNVGGAGKWKKQYNETLKGKNIFLIPDNDLPGIKHMNTIGESLLGVAKSVKIFEIPNCGEKEDISDYMKKFDTPTDLVREIYINAKPLYIVSNNEHVDVIGNTSSLSIEKPTNVVKFPTLAYKDYILLQKENAESDLFYINNALVNSNVFPWIIRQTLERLAQTVEPKLEKSKITEMVDNVCERTKSKKRNLTEEVREFILLQKGYFFTTDILQSLHFTTKHEKKALSVILVRLQADGIIEKHGERRGCYRTVENELKEMRFIENDIPEYYIKLPFGLNDVCKLHSQNIVVVAGSKSSGKTTFLMNIAKMNQDERDVLYINSEMGVHEWTDRMKLMGYNRENEIKYKTIQHHSNFHDVINGKNRINIIDYLEIHDNFYEIAKPIRKIHEKLGDGICLIGIQKKASEKLARGAEFSMEKSRLYLTLDYLENEQCSKLTIIDAKAPKVPGGCRGLWKRIKIINGSTMQALDRDWRR